MFLRKRRKEQIHQFLTLSQISCLSLVGAVNFISLCGVDTMILYWYNPGGIGLGSSTARTESMYAKKGFIRSLAISNQSQTGALTALRTLFSNVRRPWIARTPIQRLRIRVDPEETLVPPLTMSLTNRAPRILVQKLANHRLRNRVDDRRVGRRVRHVRSAAYRPGRVKHSRARMFV